jgi:hypothetical protein
VQCGFADVPGTDMRLRGWDRAYDYDGCLLLLLLLLTRFIGRNTRCSVTVRRPKAKAPPSAARHDITIEDERLDSPRTAAQ